MIRLFLIRHGNTFESDQIPVQVGARTDLPLTEQGRKQAQMMAEYFQSKKIHPSAIYAGNLKRQTEFAQILGKNFQIQFLNEPSLTEIDYGAWEGLTSEQLTSRWPKEYAEWTESGKWPEPIFRGTWQNHKSALDDWINRLRKTYSNSDTVAAVSSNGLMRLFKNEKVKTGHFCELHLFPDHLEIQSWNQPAQKQDNRIGV